MIKMRNRRIALLLVLAMLATMFIGVGTASAATTNSVVGATPTFSSTSAASNNLAKINIKATDAANIVSGDTFVLTLPSGVEWYSSTGDSVNGAVAVNMGITTSPATLTATTKWISSTVMNVTIQNNGASADDYIQLTPHVRITSVGSGEIKVNLAAPGTAIAQGDYTVGLFSTKSVTATALTTPTVGAGNARVLGIIRVIENSMDSVATGNTIIVKLPAGVTWNSATPTATSSNNQTLTGVATVGDRTATFTVNNTATSIGIYDINVVADVSSTDAKMGDITANLSGTANASGDIVIGKYADYSADVTVATAKAVTAGKDDQDTATITVKENIAGSLVPNRTISFTLPENVRWASSVVSGPTLTLAAGDSIWTPAKGTLSNSRRTATFTLANTASTSAAELKLDTDKKIDIAANVSGDIKVTVGGTAGVTGEVVIANCAKLVTITSVPTDIKTGVQNQAAGDIVITEGAKEAIAKATSHDTITLTAPTGVTFGAVPTVTVTSGNLEIDTVSKDGAVVTIKTKATSTTPSTITVSGIVLTATRDVPEGPIDISLAGNAIMQNATAFDNVTSAGSATVAKVVTPADVLVNNESDFVVGASKYTLNGKEVDAFAPSYIKDSRTYLAIRDIGAACGIDQSNILWDGTNSTVTMMKGDKVVQLKIGSKSILINGAAVTIDVAPEVGPSNRTMLPAAFVAQAFGATASFDPVTNTVTIK